MTSPAVAAYHQVLADIASAARRASRMPSTVTLVAVTKTHDAAIILPVIAAGHRVFGENRVQEAQGKWPELRKQYPDLELHLIGPLQSNKAAEAVALFDVIQTIDRKKIAAAIAKEITRQKRQPKLFLQVNTGLEPQKAGVPPQDVDRFLDEIRKEFGLVISGLMCIPPVDEPPSQHFRLLAEIARRQGIACLSMGMSGDFVEAIANGATHVRVGTAIFGTRPAASLQAAKSRA